MTTMAFAKTPEEEWRAFNLFNDFIRNDP